MPSPATSSPATSSPATSSMAPGSRRRAPRRRPASNDTPTTNAASGKASAREDANSGRERILDVAARAFLDHGYDGTSLRQLATAAGMKAGSVYYHFGSKDELFTEVLRRGIAVMDVAFDDAEQAVSAHDDADDILETHVRAHLAALFENGPYTAAHVTTFRTAPASVRNEIIELRDRYEERWTQLLNTVLARGTKRTRTDLTVARLALFGAMNSSVEWFDPERSSLDQFAHTLTDQFWNGVAA